MHRLISALPAVLFALALPLRAVEENVATPAHGWVLADSEHAGARAAHFLFYAEALKKALLIGGSVAAGDYVMAFDPESRTWAAFSAAAPKLEDRQSLEAAASDLEGKRIYFLSARQIHVFDTEAKAWSVLGEKHSAGLIAETLAYDPVRDALLLLGAKRALDEVGWMGGASFDLKTNTWKALEFGDDSLRAAHKNRREAGVALEELAGRIRHAWYRDPQGAGREAERKALMEQVAALQKLPGLGDLAGEAAKLGAAIESKQLLDALKAARALQRAHQQATEAASPVPPARRHSLPAVDLERKVLLLFGGDHDDYTTNDTWLLDLTTLQWKRAQPKHAPAARAGHGLVYLPQCKKFALWDGFRHNSSQGYRSFQAELLPQREVWLFDAAGESWELAASWPRDAKGLPFRTGMRNMGFFGYTSQPFPMALAADTKDRLILVGGSNNKQGKRVLNGTWTLALDSAAKAAPVEGQRAAPNSRHERTGPFLASYCEDPAPAQPLELDKLPANTWTELPAPPKKPYFGWRKLDYGTAAWNPHTDEILHWGGGHCDSSSSVVTHWSLNANRMVLAYDLDEPYGSNGGGPDGMSLLGRPWVGTHAYRSYGYDFKHHVMILLRDGRGNATRLYDPVAMRWLERAPKQPFDGHCYSAHVIPTPHGAVVWAGSSGYMGRDGRGLWLYQGEEGWKELAKPGSMPACHVDTSCSTYDSKRDRVLLIPGKDWGANLIAVGMKDGASDKLTPANPGLCQVSRKEAAYLAHCDWVLLLNTKTHGEGVYHQVYDCANNRWILLDAGPLTAKMVSPGRGVMYDAHRKLVYLITESGHIFALRVDPASAKVVDKE